MKYPIILISLSALALSACAAGPDYVAPLPAPKSAGPFIGASNPAIAVAPVAGNWWRLYDDPVLDGLVADALAANTDIRVAVARLDKARASLRGARTDRLPQTTIGASGTRGRTADTQTPPGADRNGSAFDVGLDISYELDLSGRVSRNIEAARGDVNAAGADADAVRVAIVSATTRAYVDAASSAERLAVANRVVTLLDKSASVTARRADAGRA